MLSVKELKNEAAKTVSREFLPHAGALLLPSVCFLSFIYAGITLADLSYPFAGEAVFGLAVYLLLLFAVAMTVPLLYGYAVFLTNCVKYGKSDFSDMFCAFSSSELYFRSFKMFYSLLWRFLLTFAVPSVLINIFVSYTNGSIEGKITVAGYDLSYTLQVILILVSVITAVLVYGRYLLSVYIAVQNSEKPVSKCFFAAKIFRKNSRRLFSRLALSLVPLTLLGILTFGIALIYILPLVFTAFFILAHRLYFDAETCGRITNMILH